MAKCCMHTPDLRYKRDQSRSSPKRSQVKQVYLAKHNVVRQWSGSTLGYYYAVGYMLVGVGLDAKAV